MYSEKSDAEAHIDKVWGQPNIGLSIEHVCFD